MKKHVWISGLGIISTIGETVESFRTGLQEGRCGINHLPDHLRKHLPVSIGALLPDYQWDSFNLFAEGLPSDLAIRAENCFRRSPVAIKAAIQASIQAWRHARMSDASIPPNRRALVVAGNNITSNYAFQMQARYTDRMNHVPPSYALHHMDTDHIGILSEIFCIHGEGFTVGGASASGNIALIKAYQLLMDDIADICMVIGTLADLSPLEITGYVNIGAMGGKKFANAPKLACRPFDKDCEGFIWGQAAGCILMESHKSIETRSFDPLAEMIGGASVLHASRSAAPDVMGEARAMYEALENANSSPQEIGYINAHGTSSPIGDETEIKAIRQVFKNRGPNIWINSTKGLMGHCLSSAGVVEAIATIIQMRSQFVHPNRNLVNPIDPDIQFCGCKSEKATINVAMSNSFGFGGINSSVVFKAV